MKKMSPRVRRIIGRANPRMAVLASRVPPFVVVHHVGRRSGRPYSTPVVAFAGRDEATAAVVAAAPMVWGRDADWCRNIRAAGSYRLTRGGTDYLVDDLRIVEPGEAVRLVGAGARLTDAVFRPDEWIVGRLHPAPGRVTV